jgi:uncharacterized protein YegL
MTPERRLPIYFVICASESMRGDPLVTALCGFIKIAKKLRGDPQANETVHISVIVYGSDARQIIPLTAVDGYHIPLIEAQGERNLGAALRTLCACVDKQVREWDSQIKGDWLPLVLLMTGGDPTDDWEAAIPEVRKRAWGGFAVWGVGPNANADRLLRIANSAVKISDSLDFIQHVLWRSEPVQAPRLQVRACRDRRLPVYLLLDTSGAMVGTPIDAVREGVQLLVTQLRSDPQAIETVHVSVITFDSAARQVVPLTAVDAFQVPTLEPQGTRSMGAGLLTLCACADAEVDMGTTTTKGDWKPYVFLITGGDPTDDWEAAIPEVRKRAWGGFIACCAGPDIKTEPLKKIAGTVVKLHEISDLGQFIMPAFRCDDPIAPEYPLPPVPQNIRIVP